MSTIWQATVMADYYENLAADYDWLFGDDALATGLAINHPATARLLERTSHASAVLDTACGTGLSAAALARRGYHVWAADGSDAMVEMAAARFRHEHLEIPLIRCRWADLPAAVDERFDVVLCIGNSLVHAAGRDAMIQALTGFRQVVRPGGHVVVDSRNWEKLHAERRIVQVADRVVTRHGRRCIVLYAWETRPSRPGARRPSRVYLRGRRPDRAAGAPDRFLSLHARRTARTTRSGGLARSRHRLRRWPRPLRRDRGTGLDADDRAAHRDSRAA
jgi:SAM-dependent methyltransferase